MEITTLSTEQKKEKAILVGVHRNSRDLLMDSNEQTLEELSQLVDTAGAEVLAMVIQNKASIENATYIGQGKVQEVKQLADDLEADVIIFDDELSGAQVRNLETEIGRKVIDRSMLILDIFAARAQTSDGKLQVELALLKYTMPRLIGYGMALSRLGGGIGTRGPGESKLETDRRHVRFRIHALEQKLEELQTHRNLLTQARQKRGTPVVALVGYTNAGKSTILNVLTQAGVLAENMLFATLDPTVRKLTLPDRQNIMLVDTVGFIRKLPHHLINAFKSTLQETMNADVILHVVDASHAEMDTQMAVVHQLITELGGQQKPILTVYNKIDKKPADRVLSNSVYGGESVEISALSGQGIEALLALVGKILFSQKSRLKLLIPYDQGSMLAVIHERAEVLSEQYLAEGIEINLICEQQYVAKYAPFVV